LQYLLETADNLDGLPFKLHDFGFRGSTSVEVRVCTWYPLHQEVFGDIKFVHFFEFVLKWPKLMHQANKRIAEH